MNPLPLSVALLLCAIASPGQSPRYVTITTLTNAPPSTFEVPAGQCARVAAVNAHPYGAARVSYFKDGIPLSFNGTVNGVRDDVVVGPALFKVEIAREPNAIGAMLTLELSPYSFPPGRTLVIGQTTNAVTVSMEMSTDLVTWTAATNGLYGASNSAAFFRVSASGKLAQP